LGFVVAVILMLVLISHSGFRMGSCVVPGPIARSGCGTEVISELNGRDDALTHFNWLDYAVAFPSVFLPFHDHDLILSFSASQ
jgi:hypothetical protein